MGIMEKKIETTKGYVGSISVSETVTYFEWSCRVRIRYSSELIEIKANLESRQGIDH